MFGLVKKNSAGCLPGESIDDQKVAHNASDANGEDYSPNSVVGMIRDVYCREELRRLMHHSNLKILEGHGTLNNNFMIMIHEIII